MALLVVFVFLYGEHPFVSLLFEDLEGLQHDLLRLVLAERFHVEFEYVLSLPKVDLVSELLVSDALAAGAAFPLVAHHG